MFIILIVAKTFYKMGKALRNLALKTRKQRRRDAIIANKRIARTEECGTLLRIAAEADKNKNASIKFNNSDYYEKFSNSVIFGMPEIVKISTTRIFEIMKTEHGNSWKVFYVNSLAHYTETNELKEKCLCYTWFAFSTNQSFIDVDSYYKSIMLKYAASRAKYSDSRDLFSASRVAERNQGSTQTLTQ